MAQKSKSKPDNQEPQAPVDKTFFQLQTEAIGFDPKVDVSSFSSHPDEPFGNKTKHPLFWEDEHGNVCIGIMDLSGELVTYDSKDSRSKLKIKPICIKRLKKPLNDAKYLPEKIGWGTFPYPTPGIIKAYQADREIRKLVVVEGYKKAFALHKLLDVPTIGIPGINQWKGKGENEIYQLIRDVVLKCNVKEIIFLTDADTLVVEYKEGKDLYKRPYQFYSAVCKFKDLTRDFEIDCWFTHIRSEYNKTAKGIDDLMVEFKDDLSTIKAELLNASGQKKYLTKISVSAKSHTSLKDYFYIKDPYNAQKFYQFYEKKIGLDPFIYNGAEYQYNDYEGELICHKSRAAQQFLMIQDTFYMKGAKPTAGGRVIENVLIPITEKAILIMNRNNKHAMERIKSEVEYFHGAINYPSHKDFEYFFLTEDSYGNAMKWYNMYKPVTHLPEPGECPNSIAMVKHIFGEKEIEFEGKKIIEYELGLDYIKLLWEQPRQILPVLVLGSEERQTGKTTFWDWMKRIFQQNARSVQGEDLGGQFTSYFANSLLIVIEEAMFEKRKTIEIIKEMATAKKARLEAKHQNAHEIDAFMHIGLSTNNVRTFAIIDDAETRFWVRSVKPTTKPDFDLLDKLTDEIPAFLNYLEERQLVTSRKSRAWFADELITTQELLDVKAESRWSYEIMLEDALKEYMSRVKKAVVKLTKSDVKDLTPGYQADRNLIRKTLELRWKMEPSEYSIYYKKYSLETGGGINEEDVIKEQKHSGTVYTFFADKLFSLTTILKFVEDKEDLIVYEKEQIEHGQPSFYTKLTKDQVIKLGKKINSLHTDETIFEVATECKTFKDFKLRLEAKTITENAPF